MRAESLLQQEVMLRLGIEHPELVAIPVPNGSFLHGSENRQRTAVIVHNMKRTGMLTPGAADLVILGGGRGVCVELKLPPSRDLLGKRSAAGRLSEDQRAFQARCERCAVPYRVCRSWPEVEAIIREVWG